MPRTELTASTTISIETPSNGGNDNTGSLTSPFATPQVARDFVATQVDTRGQLVKFSVGAGTFPGVFCNGPLVGQNGNLGNGYNVNGLDELWQGAGGVSGQTIFRPPSGATSTAMYALGAASGARLTVQGIKFDQSNLIGDTMNIGNAGTIVSVGDDVSFGFNLYGSDGFNDITVNDAALINFLGDVTLDKPLIQATASWSANNNTLTISSASGTILPYMGVLDQSGLIPLGAFVQSVSGSTVTMSYGGYVPPPLAPTAGATNATIYFMSGGQCFLSLGLGARANWTGNGNPLQSLKVILARQAYYQQAVVSADHLSAASIQAVTWPYTNPIVAVPFLVEINAAIDTNGQVPLYIPGAVGVQTTASSGPGADQITVANASGILVGNAAGLYAQITATFSAGQTTINTSPITFGSNGYINGPGIAGATKITGGSSNTLSLSAPTISAQTNATLNYTLAGITPGAVVTDVSGNVVTLSKPLQNGFTNFPVLFAGMVKDGGRYQ